MSTLYLGTDQIALAERLAEVLDEESRSGDVFRPATIVVPNRYLAKWLRLWLARTRGIAINLRFPYLEAALWELLREQDPRPHEQPLELVDQEGYRLMVLSVLLEREARPELAPLYDYVRAGGAEFERDAWRRAWQLADRFARLIRDYEYHRQDELIQHWLRGELGYPNPGRTGLEASQRAVFHEIIKLPDGKRERLCRAAGKLYKTLPQYAMELMELHAASPVPTERRAVHLFGTTQVSALHWRTLRWLGGRYDLRLYHLNPLVGQLPASVNARTCKPAIAELADAFRGGRPQELLCLWGKAGVESLTFVCEMADAGFAVEKTGGRPATAPQGPPSASATVLSRLHDCLLNRPQSSSARLPQDTSVQIVACPGIYREVETAHNSILHNLQHTPDLKQTDIAILVTDMARYRPVLQAVFERAPRHLRYNMADFSASGMSAFGEALVGFLDLALEGFTRSRVFSVLLNPCFLAGMKTDRAQATTWLTWAERLGVYHSWDAKDKAERGYGTSPLFSWQLALRRLRLGRIMDTQAETGDGPAPCFRDVLPYADLESGDKDQLNAFCWAVEGLLPALASLRNYQASGAQWAAALERLVQRFLVVPPDRPEEAQVRDQLAGLLGRLRTLDKLSAAAPSLALALIREIMADSLEAIPGATGEYLTGGVTISALQPLRPVPFRIIYLLGLGEEQFPGSNRLPSYDLRTLQHCPGDIRPAEQNRYLFLETLLAARDKIYLLYTNLDVQRDQELHPCVPLAQLRQFLQRAIVGQEFKATTVPLSGCDAAYLTAPAPTASDVLVNYNDAERLLGLAQARAWGEVELGPRLEADVQKRLAAAQKDFALPVTVASAAGGKQTPTITLGELRRFLRCPAEAALRRHLHLSDEERVEQDDDEPFVTDALTASRLVREALQRFVGRAMRDGVASAVADWPNRLTELCRDWRLRCQLPDGVFGDIDQAALADELDRRLTGPTGLVKYLDDRAAMPVVGPVLIGESTTPVNARARFPALRLRIAGDGPSLFLPAEARLIGAIPLVWRAEGALHILVLTAGAEEPKEYALCKAMLEPVLGYLALKAGDEAGADGLSSREWLGERDLLLAVAHAKGITTYRYRGPRISAEEARDYLTRLAADFLDPDSFDLLPFELLVQQKALRAAYMAREAKARELAADYAETFEELVELDSENPFSEFRWSELLALTDPRVPADAFDKVRRRFALLARGLAKKSPRGKTRGHADSQRGRGPARPARRTGSVGRHG